MVTVPVCTSPWNGVIFPDCSASSMRSWDGRITMYISAKPLRKVEPSYQLSIRCAKLLIRLEVWLSGWDFSGYWLCGSVRRPMIPLSNKFPHFGEVWDFLYSPLILVKMWQLSCRPRLPDISGCQILRFDAWFSEKKSEDWVEKMDYVYRNRPMYMYIMTLENGRIRLFLYFPSTGSVYDPFCQGNN